MKCVFCKTRATLYYHFRATETGTRVHGVCENCRDVYGSHSNAPKVKNGFSFTAEYVKSHPRCGTSAPIELGSP